MSAVWPRGGLVGGPPPHSRHAAAICSAISWPCGQPWKWPRPGQTMARMLVAPSRRLDGAQNRIFGVCAARSVREARRVHNVTDHRVERPDEHRRADGLAASVLRLDGLKQRLLVRRRRPSESIACRVRRDDPTLAAWIDREPARAVVVHAERAAATLTDDRDERARRSRPRSSMSAIAGRHRRPRASRRAGHLQAAPPVCNAVYYPSGAAACTLCDERPSPRAYSRSGKRSHRWPTRPPRAAKQRRRPKAACAGSTMPRGRKAIAGGVRHSRLPTSARVDAYACLGLAHMESRLRSAVLRRRAEVRRTSIGCAVAGGLVGGRARGRMAPKGSIGTATPAKRIG